MSTTQTAGATASPATAQELEAIAHVVQAYFDAVHLSDPSRIEQAFHPEAQLVGHVEDAAYFKRRDEYMDVLRQRPAPAAAGVPFRMEIRSIDRFGQAAVVRTLTPIGDLNYVDFLSLQKADGRWRIVHKLFSHEPRAASTASRSS